MNSSKMSIEAVRRHREKLDERRLELDLQLDSAVDVIEKASLPIRWTIRCLAGALSVVLAIISAIVIRFSGENGPIDDASSLSAESARKMESLSAVLLLPRDGARDIMFFTIALFESFVGVGVKPVPLVKAPLFVARLLAGLLGRLLLLLAKSVGVLPGIIPVKLWRLAAKFGILLACSFSCHLAAMLFEGAVVIIKLGGVQGIAQVLGWLANVGMLFSWMFLVWSAVLLLSLCRAIICFAGRIAENLSTALDS